MTPAEERQLEAEADAFQMEADRQRDPAAELARVKQQRDELAEALRDMLSGWRYIRDVHGDLRGVGWDRAQNKAESALARYRQQKDKQR